MKRTGLHSQSVEAEKALRFFLRHVALPAKRARYLDLISRPSSRRKFLDMLYHKLECNLDPSKSVKKLSPEALSMPGYRFGYCDMFGEPVDLLAAVCASDDESFLVVSIDGKFGIHGSESYIDDRTFYVARKQT